MNLVYKLRRLAALPPERTFRALTRVFGIGKTRDAQVAGRPVATHPFDELYAIDAAGGDAADKGASEAHAYNVGYWPSHITVARKGIEAVPGLERMSFIDFGCGKGRVLVLATEYPFPRVIGLELTPALGEAAQRIADAVAAKHPERTRIEVVIGDGLAFELPPGPILLYMYHPAYAGLLKKLARKLADHQAASPDNKVFLVYANPAAAPVFDEQPAAFRRFFAARVKLGEGDLASNTFGTDEDSVVVWQTVSPTMHPAHPGADRPVRLSAHGDGGTVVADEAI